VSAWVVEKLYESWRQTFLATKTFFEARTDHQHLVIFENPQFGRVMVLDDVIQVTTGDEFVYHEMLTHVPMLAHGNATEVLVVGGGDGGILREVLKHKQVTKAVLVEIDQGVVDMSIEHMPSVSAGAYDDKRVEVVIQDGVEYMAEDGQKFDLIIIDSTDPAGPGEVLFTESFYKNCAKRLKPGGIFTCQNGVPFMQGDELTDTQHRRKPHFKDAAFYVAAVPTYVGGFMALGWATQDPSYRKLGADVIRKRYDANPFPTRYWTPDLHVASFALPRYVQELMEK
jgi:spermidine synthase